MACLLQNEPASCAGGPVKRGERGAGAKASPKRAWGNLRFWEATWGATPRQAAGTGDFQVRRSRPETG